MIDSLRKMWTKICGNILPFYSKVWETLRKSPEK